MKRPYRIYLPACFLFASVFSCSPLRASSAGTAGASFLDNPVGGRPSALGGAYSALASDVYAPVWNPAGLGLIDATQVSGMHAGYFESVSYDYAGAVTPLAGRQAIGASLQYLNPGKIDETDATGNRTGQFSGYYGTAALAYGAAVSSRLCLGLTGKFSGARISDVSARAWTADIGGLYTVTPAFQVAAVIANVGTPMRFIDQKDPLPLALRLGAAVRPLKMLQLSTELALPRQARPGLRFGAEVEFLSLVALRAGYRTDSNRELSPLVGFSTGLGLKIYGQQFDYAWLPFDELGSVQYFSFVLKFNSAP